MIYIYLVLRYQLVRFATTEMAELTAYVKANDWVTCVVRHESGSEAESYLMSRDEALGIVG
jgi:hypothetical protein